MKTPTNTTDPLAPILTRLLEMALACAPRSEQQVELVKAYAFQQASALGHSSNFVSPDAIRALAKDARQLLDTATTNDIRAIAGTVQLLERAADQADVRDAMTAA